MAFDDISRALATGSIEVCPQPIFVIGCPRSGTTALARALAEHSDMWTSHESYFLNGLFGDGRPAHVHGRQVQRAGPGWLRTEVVDQAEFLAYVGAGMNALFTSRSGGRRWIDQTPLYTMFVDDIAELFPTARFVHILRDGRSVVDSMQHFTDRLRGRPEVSRHVPAWAEDFAEACRTWSDYVSHATGFCDDNPKRCITVVNETLKADPQRGFAELFDFLGADNETAPAEYFATRQINSSYRGAAGAPAATWAPEERALFLRVCGPAMVDLALAKPDELAAWSRSDDAAEQGSR